MRAFIVEEDVSVRLLLRHILQRRGHDVTVFADGEAGLACIEQEEPFQLIMLDLTLSGMDGLNLLRRVRALPNGRRAFVMVISGRDSPDDLMSALDAGANDYLSKPAKTTVIQSRLAIAERRISEDLDRYRAQDDLVASQQMFDALFENCPAAMQIYAPDGTLLRTNAVQRQMTGELLVPGRFNVLASAGQTQTRALFDAAFNGQIIVESEFNVDSPVLCGPIRDQIMADVLLYPIRQSGDRSAVVCFVRDVTDRKRMQARVLLSDRMASIGTVAAGVAHEINNPLAYISANLSWLSDQFDNLDDPQLAEKLRPVITEAKDGAERVRQIVRELKTLSRADELRMGPVDIRKVLSSAANLANNEIRHRARLVYPGNWHPVVMGNEARLGQVFLNLLVNAAQAIPEGHAADNEIRIETRMEGDAVVVSIIDTGSGIQTDAISKLFDPFFTTKPIGEGTGLGLSIAHTIVTGLGGQIRVESELGRGSTFEVVLPVGDLDDDIALPEDTEEVAEPAPSTRVATVLVVDDELLVGKSMRRILSAHDVTVVDSGSQAVALCAQHDYDVVFCDLMMPEMTGMDVYEALRREQPGYEERLVFMSGGAFTPRARRFVAEVPNRILDKPFQIAKVRHLVIERAGRSWSRDTNRSP
jgi:signal transduction histidine kinase